MTNQLCVIESDFRFLHLSKTKKQENYGITDLLESYKQSLSARISNSNDSDNLTIVANNNDFLIVHAKDGNEICSNLLQNPSNTYDFDSTLVNNTASCNNHNNSTILNETKSVHQRGSSSNGLFICFIIGDFDQNDSVFAKLEETQSKICSFFNTTINSTVINTNVTRRFMVFGWPIINYCLENNMVNFSKLFKFIKIFKCLFVHSNKRA